MGWTRRGWALLLPGFLELVLCIESPRSACLAPQLLRSPPCLQQLGWMNPLDLLSEGGLRWWKENVFGPETSDPPSQPATAAADVENDGNGDSDDDPTTRPSAMTNEGSPEPGWRLPKWNNYGRSTSLVSRYCRALERATDGGIRAMQNLAGHSVALGREGSVWLRRRWRTKVVYCLVGIYGLRLAGRVASRIKANVLSSGDVLLDAEDNRIASRGAILDVEGQALLLRLRALRSPAITSTSAAATSPRQQSSTMLAARTDGDCDDGWKIVERSLRRAIELRHLDRGGVKAGGRGRYVEQLSDALRELEQARDEANISGFEPEHASLVEQAIVLVQTRLCDACLRSLRDGLLRAASDLSDLSSFWRDQRSNHRRMGIIKSIVLGRLVHGKISGKRAAVENDQEKMSTSELLLEGYLKKLGTVQTHLQARPRTGLVTLESSSMATAAGAATVDPAAVEALKDWVDEGMAMFLGSLVHVEAALTKHEETGDEVDSGRGGGDDPSAGMDVSEARQVEQGIPVDLEARTGGTAAAGVRGGGGLLVSTSRTVKNVARSKARLAEMRAGGVLELVLQLRAGGGGNTPLVAGGAASMSRYGSLLAHGAPTSGLNSSGGKTHRGSIPAMVLLRSTRSQASRETEEGPRHADVSRTLAEQTRKASSRTGCGRMGSRVRRGEDGSNRREASRERTTSTKVERADDGAAGDTVYAPKTIPKGGKSSKGGARSRGRARGMRRSVSRCTCVAAALPPSAKGADKKVVAPAQPETAATPSGASRSTPSSEAGGDVGLQLSSPFLHSSVSRTLATSIYARSRQRDEDYMRNRRLGLTKRKGANREALDELESVGEDGEQVSNDDSAIPDAITDSSTKTLGTLTACLNRCAVVAGDTLRGAGLMFSSPEWILRTPLSGANSSRIDLDDDDEEDTIAAREFFSSDDSGRPISAAINDTRGVSRLAACVGRCSGIAGGISRGALVVLSSPARIARVVVGSPTRSQMDLKEDSDEEAVTIPSAAAASASAAAAAAVPSKRVSRRRLRFGPIGAKEGDKVDSRGEFLTRDSPPHGSETLEGNATSVSTSLEGDENHAADYAEGIEEDGLAAGELNMSEAGRPRRSLGRVIVVHPCAYVCSSLGGGASACHACVSTCCKAANGLACRLGGGSLTIGSAALRSLQSTTRACSEGTWRVLFSSVVLVRAAGERSLATVGTLREGVMEPAGSFLGRRCGQLFSLIGKGALSACVAIAASIHFAGVAIVGDAKGITCFFVKCAAGTARVVATAPRKLSRALVIGGVRAGRAAGGGFSLASGGLADTSVKIFRALAVGSARACLWGRLGCGKVAGVVVAVSGRTGRAAASAFTTAWLAVAATAFMLGNAAAAATTRSTEFCLTCIKVTGRVLFVLPVKAATRIVAAALVPFSGGNGDRGGTKGMPTRLLAEDLEACRALFLRGRSPEDDSNSSTLSGYLPPSVVHDTIAGPSEAASRVQDLETSLARWVSSAPSTGVPEASGYRSRKLVQVAARGSRVTATSRSMSATTTTDVLAVTRALPALAAEDASAAGATRPAHWRRVRTAVRLALVAPLTFRSARYAQRNRSMLKRVAAEAATGVNSFFSDQLWQPCEAIAKQILFRERTNLMDEDSLDDAETSLQNMLRDFVNDKNNRVPEELREEAVNMMDMSVVSRKLEQETKSSIRGTVNGRIPRMLLIQATFLKKELLHAMQSIDELFQANQVTLRLISVIPAALLIFAGVKLSERLVHAASSRRLEPTALIHRSMRASLRKIERLLTSSRGFVGSQQGAVLDESADFVRRGHLDDEEMGRMALHLHELQTTLRQNRSRFDSKTRGRLEEDLADLMATGCPLVVQQLAVLHRMQRSYGFLSADGGGSGRRRGRK